LKIKSNAMVRLNDSYEYDFYYGASPSTKAMAAELRKKMTTAEKVLWQQLRNNQIDGLKFRRQHPVIYSFLTFIVMSGNSPLR
jgi:very-short-patch-repair endonuclease